MRSLWLAAAAFLIPAGMACAQTAATAPAPQGATQAPVETPKHDSSGKTAPTSPSGTVSTLPGPTPGTANSATTTPAPDGAVNAPVETPSQDASGRTAPTTGTP